MKTNYNDYFSEDKIKEFIGKMDELAENIQKELGFENLEEGSNPSEDQIKLVLQTAKERVIAEIFAKGENISNLWLAISDKDLAKITALKVIITNNDYLDTLATALFINSAVRNDEVVKFLLTETEIAECNNLKAEMVSPFLQIEKETDWNGEIIELLLTKNEKAHKAFFEEIHNLLCGPSISNEFLIENCFKYISDINEPLIINSSTDGGQTFHEEQTSLLIQTVHTQRTELTKYLIAQGAHVLPAEVSFILYNTEVFSDEFLIDCLKNNSNVNKPVISNVSTDEGQTFHEEQSSLLNRAIQSHRPGLAKWLIDQGAYVLPAEVPSIMWNPNISDECLIGCFENTLKLSTEAGQTFHEEKNSLLMQTLQNNRPELTKWLIDQGAYVLLSEIPKITWNYNISDEYLIDCFKNAPVIKDQISHEGQSSLLMGVLRCDKRQELAKWLVDQGAYLLPSEVREIMWNSAISDEFLIGCLKNVPVIVSTITDFQICLEGQSSLIMLAIQNKRLELTKWLADQGGQLLPLEVREIMWNFDISDEFLIGCLKKVPDINKPLISKISIDLGQSYQEEQSSLLAAAVNANRLGLTKWLVDQGADVNFSITCTDGRVTKLYSNFYDKIEIFKTLVASGRLEKNPDMDSLWIQLDSEITLDISKCYDLLTWQNNFEATLNNHFVSFENWLGNGCMHYADNLFTIPQKFLNTAITYLSDDVLLRQLQDKYGNDIITLILNNVGPLITTYFVQNWHQSMLICKDFGDHNVFSMVELRCLIGHELYDYQWDHFSAQIVTLAGEEVQVEEVT